MQKKLYKTGENPEIGVLQCKNCLKQVIINDDKVLEECKRCGNDTFIKIHNSLQSWNEVPICTDCLMEMELDSKKTVTHPEGQGPIIEGSYSCSMPDCRKKGVGRWEVDKYREHYEKY